jgi:hypothetical protein
MSVLENLPSLIDQPVGRAAPSPPPRPGEADIIIVGRSPKQTFPDGGL